MSISLTCDCGRPIDVPNKYAGSRYRCPACGFAVPIPVPAHARRRPQAAPAQAPPPVLRVSPPAANPDAVQGTRPMPASRSDARVRDSVVPEPSPALREPDFFEPPAQEGWFGNVNTGVAGGVLMILIAVGWFLAGLAVNRFFFYPPVLLVVGIAAVALGVANRRW